MSDPTPTERDRELARKYYCHSAEGFAQARAEERASTLTKMTQLASSVGPGALSRREWYILAEWIEARGREGA